MFKNNKDKLLFAKFFVEKEVDRIGDWVVGDIRRCCRLGRDNLSYENNGSMIGAYILWLCSLDYLGGWLTNSDNYYYRIGRFIDEYLNTVRNDGKKYSKKGIRQLRSNIVHNYTGHNYILSTGHSNLHLAKKGDYIILCLEEIVKDTEKAFMKLKQDLLSSDNKSLTAFSYYIKHPPFGPVQIGI